MTHDQNDLTSDNIVTLANGCLDTAIQLLDLLTDATPTNDKDSQRS